MSQEQDKAFFRNFTFILIMLALLMATFMSLGIIFGGFTESPAKVTAAVMKNTEPVGQMRMQGDEPEAVFVVEESATTATGGGEHVGKTVYEGLCVACHGSGIPGIPQLGDVDAWAPRIEQGNAMLHDRAINGYTGNSGMPMPARGGDPSLSDDDVKAAVDYMVANSQ